MLGEENLILVEGLPSAGKTTVSRSVNQYLVEQEGKDRIF
ncbi:KTI12 family protein [Halanaerobacter jeridensis]|uniref:tRNA uridine 5-carbamoylmethylation protein Kti12 n=1 Tax=Halanaerobacter jeridensis TaxID=706427 RepID=A0A938XRV7_9FIRM|nr:tRNA uridine 5-carbamoylmethylation protein Kti12 [Halanaerobacter jeridensis]